MVVSDNFQCPNLECRAEYSVVRRDHALDKKPRCSEWVPRSWYTFTICRAAGKGGWSYSMLISTRLTARHLNCLELTRLMRWQLAAPPP
jgi:hypothetical protein